ncbi:MAG: 5-formyltetrahydrofolate cyclo-ligase [Pontibacterium sp.]
MPSHLQLTRKQIRQQIRRQRRNLSQHQQTRAALNLRNNLATTLSFQRAKHIALYLANDGEIDPMPLIKYCWKLGKQVYLPLLHPIATNRLWFVHYTPSTPMTRNKYGISEPKLRGCIRRTPKALDLVCLPLVAFDCKGNRMGMGGGYYDRTFSFKMATGHSQKPTLMGLAHELQRLPSLPVESWDIPLDAIVSDKRIYQTSTKRTLI